MTNNKRTATRLFAVVAGHLLLLGSWLLWADDKTSPLPTFKFPGESHRGALPELRNAEREESRRMKADVTHLAVTIGERNVEHPQQLAAAAEWLMQELATAGYVASKQTYNVDGVECSNLIVEIKGSTLPDEIVLVGAHYDSAPGTPGANDNGSGTAACLSLARRLKAHQPERTMRFVFFVNEEPPHFQKQTMGSLVYARRCKERRENLVAVLSLETLGYYSDKEGAQQYPPLLSAAYPSTGNFVAFVGNIDSKPLVSDVISLFRKHAKFPSEAGSLPGQLRGVGWSDHWSFWEFGYQGVMVTDTAPFRYSHYHRATDTPEKIDFDRLARVTLGLEAVIKELCQQSAAQLDQDNKLPSKLKAK